MKQQTLEKLRSAALLAAATLAGANAGAADNMARVILAEHPAAYYRLDDPPGSTAPVNLSAAQPGAVGTATYVQGTAVAGPPGLSTNSALFSGNANAAFISLQAAPELSPVSSDGKSAARFSVEAWTRPTPASATDSSVRCLLSLAGAASQTASATASSQAAGWDFSEVPGNPVTWQFTIRTAAGPIGLADPTPVKPGQWAHLAATWDGTTATFFVNGQAVKSSAAAGYVAPIGCAAAIGAGPAIGRAGFAGAVSDVAFYSYVLHPNSISNHFAVGMRILNAAVAAPAVNP